MNKIIFISFFVVALSFSACKTTDVFIENSQTYTVQDSNFTVSVVLKEIPSQLTGSTLLKITVRNNSKSNVYFTRQVAEYSNLNEYSIICGYYTSGGPEHSLFLKRVKPNDSISFDVPKSYKFFKENFSYEDFTLQIYYLTESNVPLLRSSESPVISRDDFQIKFEGLEIKPQISFKNKFRYFNFFQ